MNSSTIDAGKPRRTDVPWYAEKLDHLHEGTRQVLEKYSKIPPDQVIPHVYRIRDEGWKIVPYPCIGHFRFTDLSLGQARQYPEVLERVKSGQRFLDMGCCFAQDIRRLVYDGAPADNLYGSDLIPAFLDLGYDLFRDKDTLSAHLFSSDIFADEARLGELDGSVDIIHASSFFHLFELEPQLQITRRFIKLLKPVPGSMILGRHMGNTKPGRMPQIRTDAFMYRHDLETWKKMWDDVGAETGTKWRVEVEWDRRSDMAKWQSESAKPMRYAVWRE